MKPNTLVIEDDEVINLMIMKYIKDIGHKAVGVHSLADADRYLKDHEPDLIITDVRLPDGDCMARLPDYSENQPVVVLTAYGSVKNAVEVMKAGASEYLTKPINPDELTLIVQRALDNAALRNDHQFCKRHLQAKENSTSLMIGQSQALDEVKQLIGDVATSDLTVLILGESGSGKELIAHAIHQHSDRSDRNFVAVDCCTLQDNLFESELFGHERGAFTGADKQKKGLIEGAQNGTLFLDEIGEIGASIQAKLLRVLETGKFRRVGGTKDLSANVRIVAATNRNLNDMYETGDFRQDLYYRLEAFTITSPPLRERRNDIPSLVDYFIHNNNFSCRINKCFTKEAIRKLVAYDWPGNVRELKNVVERAIILSRDKKTIRAEHLTFGKSESSPAFNLNVSFDHDPTLTELEQAYLRRMLEKFAGHRAMVAQTLGISERHVYRLIQKYELEL
ncbi:MAG: sigma-54-dependent transcriptional regulator [Arenicellales bacterium]